jgi:short-subunit dehydrogenase
VKNVTFVTGASSGLGRKIASSLAARGDAVVVVARRRELLDALVREIEAAGGRARAITCDVTDPEQVSRAVASVESTDGPIERLVSCVGGGERTTIDGFRAAQVEQMLSLNVMGTANCLEAVLPRMLRRQRGHIVAISSLAAARGLPGAAEYSAAKAALSTLFEGLRIDLKPRGIDVTILSPGFIKRGTSKRRRPMKVPLDVAAARMVKAIERRRKTYSFPKWLAWSLAALRCLPPTVADALVSKARFLRKGRQTQAQRSEIDPSPAAAPADRPRRRMVPTTSEMATHAFASEAVLEIGTETAPHRVE